MSLSSYLASKYLTAESSSSSNSKKRKRKVKSSNIGLTIADDDALGWSNNPSNPESNDHDAPLTISSGSAEFRKAKKSAWKTVGVPVIQPKDLEADEADRIIDAAEQDRTAAHHADEDPTVLDDDGVVKMSDGTYAGLQTSAAVAKQFEKRKREEMAAWEEEERVAGRRKGHGKSGEETVYRDATGRRIDLTMRRAEARKEADEKARKQLEEQQAQRGDVQVAAREKHREELEEARFMPLARKIDDEEMNKELKEQERWNDPAAQFTMSKKKGKSASGRPLYRGAAAPNRYGIRPGHKWDGVDRGNGWESERFKALNRATRNKELDFAWQMDE